ncbi:hypothetical protein [Mucilaginibacter jinjuensis]|uniref:IPExxxVDY family protein n=1 Tax=Mucilaginibacter jinjuensis TaxID=1176721 RepID=A0ABY7T9J3_9SPHI|nr:hypothetical protein [Mucilaginibacter jinjuensis]WCT12934.1 hypothetical protein PQO05_03170 [Mucilaginibacter jinjuensis]
MEVATIITSSKDTCALFDEFIHTYQTLYLTGKDSDTVYFTSVNNDKERLFYHYKLNDIKEEFSYNYSAQDIIKLKEFYGDKPIFMFDLSYRPETLLIEILKAFKIYVEIHRNELLKDVLISHPFDGLKSLEAF